VSELPPGWVTSSLGQSTDITSGIGFPKSHQGQTSGDLGFYKVGDISRAVREHNGELRNPEHYVSFAVAEELRGKPIAAGATVFAKIGEAIRLNRRAVVLQPSLIDNNVMAVKARPPLSDRYLFHFMRTLDFAELSRATTVPSLRKSDIEAIELPLAPLPEQKRIADKLEALLARVDACRQRLDRVSGVLKRFRQSVLAAATSGELTREWREGRGLDGDVQSFQLEDAEAIRDFSFPASWSARRLADIATITGGVTKDSKKQSADFVELPYLRVANVQRGYLDLSEVKTIRVPPDRVSELLLRAGDILFNEGGDIDKLGRGWIWNDELPACVFQNHVFRARLLDPTLEPRYFSWYGNSRGYEYFLARGKQTTNLASINKSVLSALPVAVPPADEQAEIVRRTNELLQFADGLERCCTNAAAQVVALTPSALARAFRGELVPQDPNDEPASALLAKLKTAQTNAVAEPLRRHPKTPEKRPTMSNTDKDSIKAAILKLKTDRFSFDELRAQVSGDYESLKLALFALLEEPSPVVRQVFDKKAKAMQLVRVRP
jgi:type I restriction enzyme S subunit